MVGLLQYHTDSITTPEHLFNLLATKLANIKARKEIVELYSRWHLSPEATKILELFGITINNDALFNHAHPVNKTIEQYIIHVILPALLTEDFTLLWSKDNSSQLIADVTRKNVTVINIKFSAKDHTRYSHSTNLLTNIEHRMCYMFDAAHFLSPNDIYSIFDNSPNMEIMFCTVIIPSELLDNQPPLFPLIYTFKVIDQDYQYYPDGHVAGEYTQPLSSLWWFKINQISGPSLKVTIQKLDSYGAHHIFMLTKLRCQPPTLLSFDFPGRVELPTEIVPYLSSRYRSIDSKLYKTVISYATSVGSVKTYQIKARSRAAANSSKFEVPLSDEFLATQFADALNQFQLDFIPSTYPITRAHHLVTRKGPIRWLRLLLNTGSQYAWEDFLTSLDPPPYTATQKLHSFVISDLDDCNLSSALTGELPPMNHRDLHILIEAIFKNASHSINKFKPKNNHNRVVDFETLNEISQPINYPYFSNYFTKHTLRHFLPSLLSIKSIQLGFKFIKRFTIFSLNHPRLTLYLSPAYITLFYLAKLTGKYGYLTFETYCSKKIHQLNISSHLPSTLSQVYTSLKYASAPMTLRPSLSQERLFSPIKVEHIKPDLMAITNLSKTINNMIVENSSNTSTLSNSTSSLSTTESTLSLDLHHGPCNLEICNQHVINVEAEQLPGGLSWRTCQGNHGFYGQSNGKCHLCIELIDMQTNSSTVSDDLEDLLDGNRVCLTRIEHPTLNHEFNCALSSNAIPGEVNCPQCLNSDINDSSIPPIPSSNMCLFIAVHQSTGINLNTLWSRYAYNNPRANAQSLMTCGWDLKDVEFLALRNHLRIRVDSDKGITTQVVMGLDQYDLIAIRYTSNPGHYSVIENYNGTGYHKQTTVSCDLIDDLALKWKSYKPNHKRADIFLTNIELGHYGLHLSKDKLWLLKMKSCLKVPNLKRQVKLAVIYGAPGSGKTYPITQILSKIPPKNDCYRMIFPSTALRNENVQSLKLKSGQGFKAPTPETPFMGSYTPLMIGDELGKFPPGYFDLLIIACPTIKHLILSGDPAQSIYSCPKEGNSLNMQVSEIDHYSKYALCYLRKTRRLCCGVAHTFGVEHYCNSNIGDFTVTNKPITTDYLITGSTIDAKSYNEYGKRAYTMTGSQGLNISRHLTIIADDNTAKADDRAWYTAITRSTKSIIINIPANKHIPPHSSKIAQALFTQDPTKISRAIINHIANYTPPHLLDPTKSSNNFNGSGILPHHNHLIEKLPHLSGIIDETPDAIYLKPIIPKPGFIKVSFKQSFIRGLYNILSHNLNSILALIGIVCPQPRISSSRDILFNGIYTQQVDEKNDATMLFLRHHRNDEATTNWTNLGRFVSANNRQPLRNTRIPGHLLLTAFESTFKPNYPPFSPILFETAATLAQQRFLDKGFKSLLNIKCRADPDWCDEMAELFMKGQSITKPGTIDKNAKMGQLVISFNTYSNFKFGPLAKYIRSIYDDMMPDNFFFLDGKTDTDLSNFVIRLWDFTVKSSEDDYTAFDSTQGGEFLNFDALFMQRLDIPQFMIDDYLNFMTSIYTWMGKMGYMMPTGCQFTLLFNSNRSAAYQCLKYKIPSSMPIALTGDDVACNGTPPYRPTWIYYQHLFKLVSKRNTSYNPTFCGWILTPAGCFKDPNLLLVRTMYQFSRNNLRNCIYNYASDLTPLHKNFELMMPHLTEDQIEDHYTTLQILQAEAQIMGINLEGSFMTSYGEKKIFDLHYD